MKRIRPLIALQYGGRSWMVTAVGGCRRHHLRHDDGGRMLPPEQYRTVLSDAVQQRLQDMVSRHASVLEDLKSTPTSASNKLSLELAALAPAVSLQQQRHNLQTEEQSWRDLAAQAQNDLELRDECERELAVLQAQLVALEARMVEAVLPHDPDDGTAQAIVEVRAGTGGDEASLFASELVAAYSKCATEMGFGVETLSCSRTEIGGVREASLLITGGAIHVPGDNDDNDDATMLHDAASLRNNLSPYGMFKYESGGHRVQRVPINDVKLQTSACSVAVLPAAPTTNRQQDNNDDLLPLAELKIETMRASGAGGQHINTTDSAVRITHLPTGLQASIQDQRSQHRNKEKALQLITARVRDQQRAELMRQQGATRSRLLGGGDRSERIRTYNFPQDRVTDHRCKVSHHGIASLLAGHNGGGLVMAFLRPLQELRREELLAELEQDEKRP